MVRLYRREAAAYANFAIGANVSGLRLAPPTKAPSMFSFAMSCAALSGFTEPPYWMQMFFAASAPYSRPITALM
jgi:hypothetical protein